MIVATVDANVLLSGFTSRQRTPAQVLLRWNAGTFSMALADYIIAEVERAFERPYFTARLSPSERATNIALLQANATIVAPDPAVQGVSRDPHDDPVLGTAVAANAGYLVSGDADLLALGRYGNVSIVAPRAFLAVLQAEADALREDTERA